MKHVIQTTLALAMIAEVALHAQTAKTQTATGVVKAVSESSLTIAADGHEIAFVISKATRAVGKGLYSDLVLRDPPRNRIVDVVKPGDRVTVTFRVSGGSMHAVQVRRR